MKSKDRYDKKATTIKFGVGDFVVIKNGVKKKGKSKKLKPKFTGPFRLIEKVSEVNFRVKNRGEKRGTVIHVNRMKKFDERKVPWEMEESIQLEESSPTPIVSPKNRQWPLKAVESQDGKTLKVRRRKVVEKCSGKFKGSCRKLKEHSLSKNT